VAGLAAIGALCASLGAWQLERAAASGAALARFASGAREPALERPPAELAEEERFRRLELRGTYAGEPQFLLDNMLHDGVVGYHVLTALRVPGVRERVLVNRGWVPAGSDRGVLPEIGVGAESRIVSGRLERLPRPGLRLGEAGDDSGPTPPVIVLQYPTAAELARLLGEPVFDYQLLLDPEAADGYAREWRAPALSPERHLGYAGQWAVFSMGAFAVAIVLAVRTVRRRS
jgi:surfeit locus 1 family protein